MNPYDPVISCDAHWERYMLLSPAALRSANDGNEGDDDDEAEVIGGITTHDNLNEVATEAKARRKLRQWGFDPNDVSKTSTAWHSSRLLSSSNITYGKRESRPMIIFAHLGDLPMMKYILQQSQEPSRELAETDEHGLFPLYTAISKPHCQERILAVCRWLHANGADIQQTVGGEWSPLSRACLFGFDQVAQWLLSSGALLDDQGDFDSNLAQLDMTPMYPCSGDSLQRVANRVHRSLFAWAREVVYGRHDYMLVLSGTILPKLHQDPRRVVRERLVSREHYSETAASFLLQDISDSKLTEFLSMSASPLVAFNGHSDILELIGQYVGVETSLAVLRTAQGLLEHETWWTDHCEAVSM